MKKFLIAASVGVFALASVAGAQGYTFNTNLTIGSTGADVVALQSALISAGFNIPSIASGAAAKGYFGSQTQMAVKAYQTAKGIPSTGFVGPLTRAAMNGGSTTVATPVSCPVGFSCTPVGGSTPVSTTLSGTDGTISDVTELSQYNNEEVGDDQTNVKVLGAEIEASNEGDIALKSVKVKFTITNASGSDNLDDYVDSVSIWDGSTKVGSSDVSGFNEDSNGVWSKTITLSGVVVKADQVKKLYVAVDGASLDTGDVDSESATVEIVSIRYEDGAGVTTTDDSTGDLGSLSASVSFVGFSDAADTELKFSTPSASPDAMIVGVDEDSDTDDVVILVGKMVLEGDSDVTIDELPITFTTSGDSVAAVANSVTLKLDGEEYSETVSLSAAQAGTVTFDNLDFDMSAGSTVTFTVTADINDIENTGVTATDFDEGDALKADFTADNRANMDVENEEGDDLASGEKTGTVVGEYQEFRTEGIALTLVSTATDATTGTSAGDDIGLFTIKFSVTAFGDAVYLSTVVSGNYTFSVDKSGTASSTAGSASVVNVTDTDLTTVGNYKIEDGDTETFEMTVSVNMGGAATAGQYRASLTGVKWDTTDQASLSNTYSSELDTFKTSYKVLN